MNIAGNVKPGITIAETIIYCHHVSFYGQGSRKDQ